MKQGIKEMFESRDGDSRVPSEVASIGPVWCVFLTCMSVLISVGSGGVDGVTIR